MSLRALIVFASILLLAGCANPSGQSERATLLAHPDWPKIRAAAAAEVLRREGPEGWSVVARPSDSEAVAPISRKNGVWRVSAAADYPLNTLGRVVQLEISDDGRVVSYDAPWRGADSDKSRQSSGPP